MDDEKRLKPSRREFWTSATALAAGGAVALAIPKAGRRGEARASASAGATPSGADDMARMNDDLKRAIVKKAEERRWIMVIDTRRCIGCSACTVSCIAENNLPPGVTYRTVADVEDGTYPDVRRVFMPVNCMQCDKPPCVPAANKVVPGAMRKRKDGIVGIDYRKAKGRKVFEAAQKACPYTALYFDAGKFHTAGTPAVQAYERRRVREYDGVFGRSETKDSVRKCHFCVHRLDAGMLPACVTTCTGLAMHFGDANDPESLVAEMLTTGKARRLEAGKGTEPRVYYFDDFPEAGAGALPAAGTRVVQNCASCHSFDEPQKR
jgi:molybdopterin-containing oxidoreductase family iron-sulfur binding subunit